jgi:hypothetical protein
MGSGITTPLKRYQLHSLHHHGAAQGQAASDKDMKGMDGAGRCAASIGPSLVATGASEERAGRALFRSNGSNSPNQCLVNEHVGKQV